VWELKLKQPIESLAAGRLVVEVRDQQGNTSKVEGSFSVAR
jgi:hypothetical protein